MGIRSSKSKDKRESQKEMSDEEDVLGNMVDLGLDLEDSEDDSDDSDDSDQDEAEKMSDSLQNTDKVCSKVIDGITVTVVKGDIATQQVDVIVCSTIGSMDLQRGAIAIAISKQAGPGLQRECQEKYPDGIKAGDVVETGPANLSCKKVLHVCLPRFKGERSSKVLRNAVYKCLSLASKSGHASIALPALGTGGMGYPKATVSRTISNTVKYLRRKHSDSPLTQVFCVIHPTDKAQVQAFSEAFAETYSDTTPRLIAGVHIGNISVKLTVGLLTKQQCDVVVGTATRKMELSKGALSKSILEAAGADLQKECTARYPRGINHSELAVLPPGHLHCSNIYLGALPRYDRPPEDSNKTPKEYLAVLVTSCLRQAFKDKQTTMCLPTFGTGNLRFPPLVSAQTTLQAVVDFNNNNRGVTMTVYIVLHPDESSLQKTLKPFKAAIEDIQSGLRCPRGAASTPERFTPDFCLYMYRLTDHRPPPYWSHFTDMKPIKDWKVDKQGQAVYRLVDADEQTFLVLENLVMSTWDQDKVGHGRDAKNLSELGYTRIKITKIQRVENLSLYERYVHKQAELFHKAGASEMFEDLNDLPDLEQGGARTGNYLDDQWQDRLYGEVNEGYFFHGTKAERVENLLKEGIDPRMGQGGAVFGQAIYMAESSTKADQYVDARDQRQKTGLRMFLVRASLGQVCVMKQCKKLRRPPCLDVNCGSDECSHDRYDSIVEEGKFIFREFILYDAHQSYPEYVITYDRV